MVSAQIVLYSTSCAPTAKGKSDINRIKNLLDAKRVQYDEVGGGLLNETFDWLLASAGFPRTSLPLLHRRVYHWRLQRHCAMPIASS